MPQTNPKQLRYVPAMPPSNPDSLSLYLKQELTKLQQAISVLALCAGAGVEVQKDADTSGENQALPATADGGFLHVTLNGAEYRIPLFSAAQVDR